MRRAEKPPCRTFGVLFPERHPPDTAIQRQGLPPDAIHGTGPPTPSAARDFRSTTIPAGKPGDRRQQILPEPALQPTEKPARDADRVEYCRHPDAGTSRWIRKSQKREPTTARAEVGPPNSGTLGRKADEGHSVKIYASLIPASFTSFRRASALAFD
jgi:hypothetical protein